MVGHPQKPAFKELLKKYKHYIIATEKVLKNGTLSIMQYIIKLEEIIKFDKQKMKILKINQLGTHGTII